MRILEEFEILKAKSNLFDRVFQHLDIYLGATHPKMKEQELNILQDLVWEMREVWEKERAHEYKYND